MQLSQQEDNGHKVKLFPGVDCAHLEEILIWDFAAL